MAETTRPAPAAPPLLKRLNEQTVLELVRDLAPVSRAEISRRAGISKPTVSLALRSLVEAGLVRESAEAPSGPSYGAVYFEPVPEAALVLGLDLGARFLRGAICDLSGTIRARQDVELQGADAERALAAVAELRDALVAATDLPGELIDGVVVGVPGVTGAADGTLQLAANVPGLEGRPFEAELEARLGLPITLENDINLAALGERWLGVARGVDDFVFLSVGTGMGAGIVLRGELHTGRHGFAGEIDFALDALDEDVDPSAPQIAELAAEIAEQHDGTSLRAPFEARSVFDAARQGDEAAQLVVDEVAPPDRAPPRAGRRGRRRRARRARRRDRLERRSPARAGPAAPRLVAARSRRRSRCRPSARPRCSRGPSRWASGPRSRTSRAREVA